MAKIEKSIFQQSTSLRPHRDI